MVKRLLNNKECLVIAAEQSREQLGVFSLFLSLFFAFFQRGDLQGAVKSFERHTCTEQRPAWEREENFCLTSDPCPAAPLQSVKARLDGGGKVGQLNRRWFSRGGGEM